MTGYVFQSFVIERHVFISDVNLRSGMGDSGKTELKLLLVGHVSDVPGTSHVDLLGSHVIQRS